MKNSHPSLLSVSLLMLLSLMIYSADVTAHPEDEFCQDIAMDPLLCAQLAELDRPENQTSDYQLATIDLDRSPLETGLLYTKLGVQHIIPLGLDHLAFVLALVLSSTRLRTLVLQISLFTLAHSITLVLSVLGLVVLQGTWIEVAIAFSIVFVAVENIFLRSLNHWRMILVFGFGLLHGLGFAGALSELGIPDDHFISALVGFNLGVEIGQLGFACLIFLLLYRHISKAWYHKSVVVPGSLLIAALGFYWLVERLI